ncbi:MAG: DUF4159 domain-containing protein [Akkermansiaceae bacterium]|nr:DUF4159 domain-containing protein [Akkermansiaceae bacterium]
MNSQSKSSLPADLVDEIPTRPSPFKATVVRVAMVMLASLGWAFWSWGPPALATFLEQNPGISDLFDSHGFTKAFGLSFQAFGLVCLVSGIVGTVSVLKNRLTYLLLRNSLILVYAAVLLYVVTAWLGLFAVLNAGVEIDALKQDRATILLRWWSVCWPALAIGVYAFWLRVMLRSRSVYVAFTRKAGEPMSGDRVLEDLRTHGRDPRHRRSLYASVWTHITILIIIPWLLSLGGNVEPYKVPKGSGNPVVAMVKMVKPKKKKKKTLTLRANSDIIMAIPDLDETEVDREMEKQTQATYEAGAIAKAGKIGKGGGTEGGWPAGMEDYKVRFIRLEHGGAGWDDGMNETGADLNFLRSFAQATGFKKIARKGESHSIALLKKYPKDGFPPFVYLTGNNSMGRVSSADMKILREYCLGGGMLIADAGSARFHSSFIHFIRQVFPDKPLLDIADDDIIYQLPYRFPEGAPAFWHHGGRRALGIKHEGRWMAFYHPGDMNDAWKSQGYTDVTSEMREAATSLGVNLVYYAFNHWDDAVTKAKK